MYYSCTYSVTNPIVCTNLEIFAIVHVLINCFFLDLTAEDMTSFDNNVLEDYPLNISEMEPRAALNRHKSIVLDDSEQQQLYIDRNSGSILRDIFKKLKRGELDAKKALDITFIGEEGIDAQGLTKEFFSLLMNSIKSGSGSYILFEGADDHLLPVISEEYHQSGYFKYIGQLIAMSVLHAGFGMSGMSRALSVFLATDDILKYSCHLSINDVPDYGVQQILREVSNYWETSYLLTTVHRKKNF